MSTELAPANAIPFLPRLSRRPTTMDRVRVRALVRRLEEGEDEVEAFWKVASDPAIGFSRFRGGAERPAELVLRRKLAALLERTAPALLAAAKDVAVSRLASMADSAVAAVDEVVTGQFADGSHARARLDGARIVLAALGIRDQGGASVSATVNVLSLGDGLRAMRHVAAEVKDAPDGDA
jgi:hypothetical protein